MKKLTKAELELITQALFDLAEGQDITHAEAGLIIEKIKTNNEG